MLLLIDNYDSFTYNLVHYLADIGAETLVKRNDKISVDEAINGNYEGIVISPGPCDPDKAGICLDLISKAAGKLPIFGVCLGHQSIAQSFGAKIVRAPLPVHGKTDNITHDNSRLFAGTPAKFEVTRYHSLIVDPNTMPDCLTATAHNSDGIIMALEHKTLPIFGVQFHPESIASQHGHDILKNFYEVCKNG